MRTTFAIAAALAGTIAAAQSLGPFPLDAVVQAAQTAATNTPLASPTGLNRESYLTTIAVRPPFAPHEACTHQRMIDAVLKSAQGSGGGGDGGEREAGAGDA